MSYENNNKDENVHKYEVSDKRDNVLWKKGQQKDHPRVIELWNYRVTELQSDKVAIEFPERERDREKAR